MSFKRDGDDKAWLNILQKRRVSELLSFDIPEDEALLTSNGRFTCLVCAHRPIFDTVNVMAVHRSGKRHQLNYNNFLKEKEDLRNLKLARRHHEYTKYGKLITKELETKEADDQKNTLMKSLGSAPYDPRVKKCYSKASYRKERIFLDDHTEGENCNTPQYSKINTETRTRYPGDQKKNSSSDTLTSNGQDEMKTDSALLSEQKYINDETTEAATKLQKRKERPQTIVEYKKFQAIEERIAMAKVKPYVSKRKQALPQAHLASSSSSISGHTQSLNLPCSLSNRHELNALAERSEKSLSATFICSDTTPNISSHQNNTPNVHSVCGKSTVNIKRKAVNIEESYNLNSQNKLRNAVLVKSSDCSSSKKVAMSDNKKEAAIKYLQAIGSGWKKDRSGNWVKDEDAEFDSDEEPPDIL